jgi:hypothetical protein
VGWSRDLGICTVDDLTEVARRCTSVTEIDVAARTFTDRPQLGDEEHTLALAVLQARAGVEALGGKAHVWIGAQSSIGPDGKLTTSLSATVTIVR